MKEGSAYYYEIVIGQRHDHSIERSTIADEPMTQFMNRVPLGVIVALVGVCAPLGLGGWSTLHGQRVLTSEPEPARISASQVMTVSPEVADEPNALLWIDEEVLLLAPAITPSELRLVDKTGSLVRTLGRTGEGPGEFKNITAVSLDPSGNILVFDSGLARLTVLSVEGRVISTTSLAHHGLRGVPGASASVGDALVMNALAYSSDYLGYWVFMVRPTSPDLAPVGSARAEVRPTTGVGLAQWRKVATGGGRIFVVPRLRYEIEVYNGATAEPVDRLVREVEWFPAISDEDYLAEIADGEGILVTDQGPRPMVDSAVMHGGLLWVASHVPARDWKDAVARESFTEPWETVVEAIDVGTGRVVGSERFGFWARGFTNRGELVSYTESPDGEPRLKVWSLSMR